MAVSLELVLATALPAASAQDIFSTMEHGGWLREQESNFLPGSYYFTKGNDYLRRGDSASAIHCWEIAAGWAMKDAQYNLGIGYFKGLPDIPIDKPRGLAWLALASERKDAQFSESLAAAWDQSSDADRAQANVLWRSLREHYRDDVTLRAAKQRFDAEMAQVTGSKVGMPGHVKVWTSGGMIDVATYRKEMQDKADVSFGLLPRARVNVGPLQPIETEVVPEQ